MCRQCGSRCRAGCPSGTGPSRGTGRTSSAGSGRSLSPVDELAAQSEHHVVDAVRRIGAQQFARADRQLQCHGAAGLLHVVGERTDGVGQSAVKRCVGDRLRDDVGHGDAHRPQQQQRREHPVEDLAEERSLLELRAQRIARRSRRARGNRRSVASTTAASLRGQRTRNRRLGCAFVRHGDAGRGSQALPTAASVAESAKRSR